MGGAQLKWQVLVIQAAAARNAPEFKGRLELVLAGVLNGKPWTQAFPPEGQALQFRQYRRLGGVFALPLNVVVKTVTARVYEGQTIRAIQAVDLD